MKKLAKDLQPGDILPRDAHRLRRVVVGFVENRDPNYIVPRTVDLEQQPAKLPAGCPIPPPMPPEDYRFDTGVEVEQLNLTPAQQHADELLALVRGDDRTRQGMDTPRDVKRRELLDKIDPPKPVTLEETLRVLVTIREEKDVPGLGITTGQFIDELLTRARRTGDLP